MKLGCRAVLVLALAVLGMILPSRSESSSAAKKFDRTAPLYQDNPYQYLYGNVVRTTLFRHGGQQFTNIEVKPVQTYPMFSQYVTFCDNQEDKLDVASGDPVVLVYSRTMHRRDCYDLMRVDIVEKARRQGSRGY